MLGTLRDLAERVGGRLVGDAGVAIARITGVDEAGDDSLTFATDERFLAAALQSRAAAVLVDASLPLPQAPPKPLIVVDNARLALSNLLQLLREPKPQGPFCHPSAIVSPDASVAGDAYIDAHAVVEAGAQIGAGSVLGPGAFVGRNARLGENVWMHPRASVMHGCVVGDGVVLHAGAVIGSEGFGWAFVDGRLQRIPQVGNVVLGNAVEIGANSCVDRAQTGSTLIGDGTKIDNLVQIGHNCRIGKHCAIAAQVGLAGTTVLGDFVKVAGQAGFKGHITIGTGATIGGGAGVWSDVPAGATFSGDPAQEHRANLKTEVMLRRLPKLISRVEALERQRKSEGE